MTTPDIRRDTRQAIICACERALASHGFRKLTMQDVADEAGLAKRTVYLHFENKVQICREVMDRLLDASLEAVDRELAIEGPGIEVLRRVLLARLLTRVDRFLPLHAVLSETVKAVYPDRTQHFRSLAGPDLERVEKAVRLGIADGTIRERDPAEMAELLVKGSNAFLPSRTSIEDMSSPDEVRKRIETFTDILIRGVSKP